MSTPLIIVQARLDSKRLPKKVFKYLGPKPVIEHIFDRLKLLTCTPQLLLATTSRTLDLPLVQWASAHSIECFQGSTHSVLKRFYHASLNKSCSCIVRITADCPLIQPKLIDEMINCFLDHPEVDYLSNTLKRSYPKGFDCEIFTKKALEITYQKAKNAYDLEHVTPYIYQHPETFCLKNFSQNEDDSKAVVCLDTPEDFEYLQQLFNQFYDQKPAFGLNEIRQLPRETVFKKVEL